MRVAINSKMEIIIFSAKLKNPCFRTFLSFPLIMLANLCLFIQFGATYQSLKLHLSPLDFLCGGGRPHHTTHDLPRPVWCLGEARIPSLRQNMPETSRCTLLPDCNLPLCHEKRILQLFSSSSVCSLAESSLIPCLAFPAVGRAKATNGGAKAQLPTFQFPSSTELYSELTANVRDCSNTLIIHSWLHVPSNNRVVLSMREMHLKRAPFS